MSSPKAAPVAEPAAEPAAHSPPAALSPPAGEGAEPQIDADEDSVNDTDSALGDLDGSSTSSLSSSIMQFRIENGRTYHSFKEGKYFIPNDEAESDRLDLQHHMFTMCYDGAMGLCPKNEKGSNVKRVLDVGCGTGIWAIDFADEHPEAEIIGCDLSPIQPSFVPPNLVFEIDDLEEPWTYARKFDYIHSRMLTGSFANWPRFFEQSFQHLEPGGYLELQDLTFPIRCDDGSLPADSALQQWSNHMLAAAAIFGRPLDEPPNYPTLLAAAGFTNIHAKMHPWPQNRWPRDKRLKELGAWMLENLLGGTEGICMALFTRALGWTKEEVDIFVIKTKADMRNTKYHAYWPVWTVYGQKPLE